MALQVTAAIGLLGALMMFAGDMLLYFTKGTFVMDGTLLPYAGIMQKLPTWRLRLGGVLGPVAAFFYCIGFCHFPLAALTGYKALGLAVTLICCFGIIVGGAYHAQFTLLGLLGRTENQTGIRDTAQNAGLLSQISMGALAIGLVLLAGLIVLGKTVYPAWFVVVSPGVLYFLTFVWIKLPQPFRVVLFGGWSNLMFVAFFLLSLLMATG